MNSGSPEPLHERAADAIVALLDRERLMSVAFNRPDGWPQVTTVGYLNEGLNLYFVVARSSQKLANVELDSRASVAIRSESGPNGDAVGVSMSGRVREVLDPAMIERLYRQVSDRHPDVNVYCPAGDAAAVLHFAPHIVAGVGVVDGRSQTQTFSLGDAPLSPSGAEARLFQPLMSIKEQRAAGAILAAKGDRP